MSSLPYQPVSNLYRSEALQGDFKACKQQSHLHQWQRSIRLCLIRFPRNKLLIEYDSTLSSNIVWCHQIICRAYYLGKQLSTLKEQTIKNELKCACTRSSSSIQQSMMSQACFSQVDNSQWSKCKPSERNWSECRVVPALNTYTDDCCRGLANPSLSLRRYKYHTNNWITSSR